MIVSPLAGEPEAIVKKHKTIDSLSSLRDHLQGAIALEHATIPPYLCALYSIHPGSNREASEAIQSVFVEEMLHLTLAANLLNAIGGSPVIDSPNFFPSYPTALPHSDKTLVVPLQHFSPNAIETFMRIEKPEAGNTPAEADEFETIGQFYRAIEDAFRLLSENLGEKELFCGDPTRQITAENFKFSGSGRIIPVYDLASALLAIDEIEEQGEGLKHEEVWDGDRDMFHADREEVAHYYRFEQILKGRLYQPGDTPQSGPTGEAFPIDWDAVYPMRLNPRTSDYPENSPVRRKMLEFNQVYSGVLHLLDQAFNGEPGKLSQSVSLMMELRDRARELMQIPSGDGVSTAGPSFEYFSGEIGTGSDPADYIINVRKNGPYLVSGGVPLVRKSIVYSDHKEALTWKKDSDLETGAHYRLCRCGQSSSKPFCDGTHAKIDFDGTETAPTQSSAERRKRFPGVGIELTDDESLCANAGFCHNRMSDVWSMISKTGESGVEFQVMHMVEQCPSGRLIYEMAKEPVEPDLPKEISVTKDGPYWVTGQITVMMSDGRLIESRNRVALCRCGHSSNKPLCDGTHVKKKFREG